MSNILAKLKQNVLLYPDKEVFCFLNQGETPQYSVSFHKLLIEANKIATHLSDYTQKPCLILLPKSPEFVFAFFGCLSSRIIAVPMPCPKRGLLNDRLLSVIQNTEAKICITSKKIKEQIFNQNQNSPLIASITFFAVENLLQSPPSSNTPFNITTAPTDIAFLQYTSGSTGNPKGVMVSHQNIIHNSKVIQRAFQNDEKTISVSWLPVYHDMGLIEGVIQPVFNGHLCYQMQSMDFVVRPIRWLRVISKFKATVSGGPNFAFDLLIKKVKETELHSLQLSQLKVLFNGAEPIRPKTIRKFVEKFAPSGISMQQFFPCYGMAESTLAITTTTIDEMPIFSEFQFLGKETATELVGTGKPILGTQIKIVDSDTKREVSEGIIGEIYVKGESVCLGYWKRNNDAIFNNTINGEKGYMRTGDLGILKHQQLFIVGRVKDLIIINGINYYPEDIENSIKFAHPAIMENGIAAFSIDNGQKELIIVTLEIERRYVLKSNSFDEIIEAAKAKFFQTFGFFLHEIVLLFPLSLPRTTSGKISRSTTKTLYSQSQLKQIKFTPLSEKTV